MAARMHGDEFDIVATVSPSNGIGWRGDVPWVLPTDLLRFHRLTRSTLDPDKRNAVIMGRRTWEALPAPRLLGRFTVVVSGTMRAGPNEVVDSLQAALALARGLPDIERIFVIGGERLFKEALADPGATLVYRTVVHRDMRCDRFFPNILYTPRFQLCYMSEILQDGYLPFHHEIWAARDIASTTCCDRPQPAASASDNAPSHQCPASG
jgi:dihydrofolate reductase